MICTCDYCGIEKDINDLVEMKRINARLCVKCWTKYKLQNKEMKRVGQ